MKKIIRSFVCLFVLLMCSTCFADYIARAEYAKNQNFQDRIKWAMMQAAVDVRAETPGVNTVLRQALAGRILTGQESLYQWATAITTNATIGAAIDANPTAPAIADNDIQFTVNSLFNAFAGVYTPYVP